MPPFLLSAFHYTPRLRNGLRLEEDQVARIILRGFLFFSLKTDSFISYNPVVGPPRDSISPEKRGHTFFPGFAMSSFEEKN